MRDASSADIYSAAEKKSKKRLYRCMILTCAVLYGATSFVLSPLLVITSNNIVYATTNIPDFIGLASDMVIIGAYALSFSMIIYSVYRFNLRNSVMLAMTYCSAAFLRYTADIIITVIADGQISADDILAVMMYFFFDVALTLAVMLFINSSMKKFYRQFSAVERANAILHKEKVRARDRIFPFSKILSTKNPVQNAALKTGIMLAAVKILTRVIYDLYYGGPQNVTDAIWMAVYYLSDVLICVIVYLISLLCLSYFDKKEQKDLITD